MPKGRRSSNINQVLLAACKRGDLWMIKTIYLVYLLEKAGVDVWWILQLKAEDKQVIYEGIERLQSELRKADKEDQTSLD